MSESQSSESGSWVCNKCGNQFENRGDCPECGHSYSMRQSYRAESQEQAEPVQRPTTSRSRSGNSVYTRGGSS